MTAESAAATKGSDGIGAVRSTSMLVHLGLVVAALLVVGGITVAQNVRAVRLSYRIERLEQVRERLRREHDHLQVLRQQRKRPEVLLERARDLGLPLEPARDPGPSLPSFVRH